MSDSEGTRLIEAIERIGRILAVQYSDQPDIEPGEKAKRLNRCGYSNVEIAEILGMTANAVNVALHRARKSKRGTKGKADRTKKK